MKHSACMCVCMSLQSCILHSQGSAWEQSGCWGGDSWCGLNQKESGISLTCALYAAYPPDIHTYTHVHSLLELAARFRHSRWGLSGGWVFLHLSLLIFNTKLSEVEQCQRVLYFSCPSLQPSTLNKSVITTHFFSLIICHQNGRFLTQLLMQAA